MGFDLEMLEQGKFKPRTKKVLVESLSAFFAEGDKPEWEVRGLTAAEIAMANEAQRKNSNVAVVLEALAGSDKAAKVEELRESLGISIDVPGEVAKRLELFVAGSVNPVMSLSHAVKFAENFPIDFYYLTNEITTLSGLGSEIAGK